MTQSATDRVAAKIAELRMCELNCHIPMDAFRALLDIVEAYHRFRNAPAGKDCTWSLEESRALADCDRAIAALAAIPKDLP